MKWYISHTESGEWEIKKDDITRTFTFRCDSYDDAVWLCALLHRCDR